MFVYKTDKYGRLTKYKARLVVKDDQQYKYDLFTKALKNQRFQKVPQEPCVVIKRYIICFFFVDDIVFTFRKKNQPNVKEIVNILKGKFKLEELKEFKQFLEIYIFKDRGKRLLQFFQQVYIEKLAITYTSEAIGLTLGPDTLIFEEELFPALSDTEISEEERRIYQKIVGSILFAIISTRPDIAFAASRLSRFNQRPIQLYIEAARRIVRYLYKTRFLYL